MRITTTATGQTPGPFLVSRHPLFRGAATAGRQRVFSWVASLRVVKSRLGSSDVVCLCGETGDRGPVRASVLLSRVLTEAGVAPLAASPAQPISESGKVLAELAVSRAWGAVTPMPVSIGVLMDTLGHADAPATCIVMQARGKDTQRKNDIHQLPFNPVASQKTSGAGKTKRRESSAEVSRHSHQMSSQFGFFMPGHPSTPQLPGNPGRSRFCVETAAVDDK